jgi:DNA invertase Pin-like site-specific DNA recombinase
MQYGYARVSGNQQDTAMQVGALRRAGVRRIIEETASGAASRPMLLALLGRLRPGDQLVVYRVDRLSRSLVDLLRTLADLDARGVVFRSLTEPVETGTPTGRLILQLLGALAEFERQLIRERCEAGRREARLRGVKLGRPRLFDYAKAARLRAAGWPWRRIAAKLGVCEASVRQGLAREAARVA